MNHPLSRTLDSYEPPRKRVKRTSGEAPAQDVAGQKRWDSDLFIGGASLVKCDSAMMMMMGSVRSSKAAISEPFTEGCKTRAGTPIEANRRQQKDAEPSDLKICSLPQNDLTSSNPNSNIVSVSDPRSSTIKNPTPALSRRKTLMKKYGDTRRMIQEKKALLGRRDLPPRQKASLINAIASCVSRFTVALNQQIDSERQLHLEKTLTAILAEHSTFFTDHGLQKEFSSRVLAQSSASSSPDTEDLLPTALLEYDVTELLADLPLEGFSYEIQDDGRVRLKNLEKTPTYGEQPQQLGRPRQKS